MPAVRVEIKVHECNKYSQKLSYRSECQQKVMSSLHLREHTLDDKAPALKIAKLYMLESGLNSVVH